MLLDINNAQTFLGTVFSQKHKIDFPAGFSPSVFLYTSIFPLGYLMHKVTHKKKGAGLFWICAEFLKFQ